MEIDKHHADVQRIERFQSLQAGQYWRAREQVGLEGIDKGEVLLLESIKWVDDAAHTVVLRAHPLKYDKSGNYTYSDGNGGTLTRHINWRTHSFILSDFLDKFEFEPDAAGVRAEELASVQAALDRKQAEMVEFSTNADVVAKVVEEGLKDAAEKERLKNGGTTLPALSPDVARAAATVATGTVANALMAGITEQKIEMLKAAAGREHLIATIQSNWIAEHSTSISETIGKMTPFYHERAAAALAKTEDVRSYVAKIMSGVASLDLYVGKDVYVHSIREGQPAPKGEPLTFVQSKLCMDEEVAIYLDVDEWFDFTKEEKFFDALCKHDDLVGQIFPTERCVVAMASTRRWIDYGDGPTNLHNNQANKQVFLLVRDGWNIYQVVSPVESHLGANKLFPSKGDGDAIFRGFDGRKIKFDEIAFAEKHAKQASSVLHYKRFLILCAGLDHRLKLFGDFYDQRDAMQFVTLDFQERYCRFVRDGDASASLPKIERQSVSAWIAEKNGFLQSGSRLACNWYTLINPATALTLCNVYERGNYQLQFRPTEAVSAAVTYRDGKNLCVDVQVSGENRTNFQERTFNAKVNVSAFKSDWGRSEEIPYLCLDTVSLADVEWYIHNRGSRTNHITFIRLFKNAKRVLLEERRIEEGTRGRMRHALIDGKVVDEAKADAVVETAVASWRAANRGKPLPTFQGNTAPRQWEGILDQMFIVARGADERIGKAETLLAQLGLDPLRVTVTGDGRIVAYAAPKPEERDDRFEPHCSVHRIALQFKNGDAREKSRRWHRLLRLDGKEAVLKEWDSAKEWLDFPSSFLSLAAKQAMLAQATELAPRIGKFTNKLDRGDFDALFSAWQSASKELTENARKTVVPGIAFPFAVVKDKSGSLKILAICVKYAYSLLYRLAPSDEDAERVRAAHLDRYHIRSHFELNFDRHVRGQIAWTVYSLDPSDTQAKESFFFDEWAYDYKTVTPSHSADPLLGPTTEAYLSDAKFIYLSADIREAGPSRLDEILSIKRPEGFGPYRTENSTVSTKKGDDPVPFSRFIDAMHVNTKSSSRDDRPTIWADHGISSGVNSVATMDDVREYVARSAAAEGGKAVHYTELPEAPAPSTGVERWYILKG